MPLYQYWCKKCLKYMEAIIPLIDSDKEIECPHCGEKMRKLLSAPYFTIK
jgi:putative FmdB family regulatory protein